MCDFKVFSVPDGSKRCNVGVVEDWSEATDLIPAMKADIPTLQNCIAPSRCRGRLHPASFFLDRQALNRVAFVELTEVKR
jgi:hypothetical protein